MDIFKLLQFFAEGGEGGDSGSAASTGDTPAAAGQDFTNALRARGVPEGKIRKDRAYKLPAAKTAPQPQQAAAAEPKETPTVEAEPPKKLSFDEMLEANEEYKAEYEKRSKENAANVRRLLAAETDKNKAMAPALEVLASLYGMDSKTLDYGELAKAIENDDRFYEDRALLAGQEVSSFKAQDIRSRAEERTRQEREESIRQQTEREWVKRVQQESAELKKQFPEFDLESEMKNPSFARMLNPYLGFSVEDAFRHVHRKEIDAAREAELAKRVAEQISANIRAGQARPTEAGAGAQSRTISPVQPAAAYDPKRSAAIKDAVSRAKATGQKIYPGMI